MKKQRLLTFVLLFGFLLGIYEGKVAVWMDGKKQPVRVFPYNVSMLPERDQRRLRDGLYFSNLSELKAFIEDYLS